MPGLDLFGRQLGDIGCDEGVSGLRAGPGAGVHPERAVGRDTVQAHAPAIEGGGDVLGFSEATLAIAQHVVAGLCAGGTGVLGIV